MKEKITVIVYAEVGNQDDYFAIKEDLAMMLENHADVKFIDIKSNFCNPKQLEI